MSHKKKQHGPNKMSPNNNTRLKLHEAYVTSRWVGSFLKTPSLKEVSLATMICLNIVVI